MGERSRYAAEVRERAVRMVWEHEHAYASQWAAIGSIAGKIGCLMLMAPGRWMGSFK